MPLAVQGLLDCLQFGEDWIGEEELRHRPCDGRGHAGPVGVGERGEQWPPHRPLRGTRDQVHLQYTGQVEGHRPAEVLRGLDVERRPLTRQDVMCVQPGDEELPAPTRALPTTQGHRDTLRQQRSGIFEPHTVVAWFGTQQHHHVFAEIRIQGVRVDCLEVDMQP